MSSIEHDNRLFYAVRDGNLRIAKAALEAGADVDGSRALPCAPILAATIANRVDMVDFLLQERADPDSPITEELPHPSPSLDCPIAIPGERALHLASGCGYVDIVRLLLKRSRVDPNATDSEGGTALTATCRSVHACVEVVSLLLEADADPTLADKNGVIPLHLVAFCGYTGLVELLLSGAPTTLNRCTSNGRTPLFMACCRGHDNIVSKLLSMGAIQPMSLNRKDTCPVLAAISNGFVNVVRVLINEGGITAVGGRKVLLKVFYLSVSRNCQKILKLLLTVNGEEERSGWANTYIEGRSLLHYGAAYCSPAVVNILLVSEADETARDSEMRIPEQVIGLSLGKGEVRLDVGRGLAVFRMLQRGPAYRARSWAWPYSIEEAGAGGCCEGATAATAIVLLSPIAVSHPPAIDIRNHRRKNSVSKLFVRLVGRYCEKD